jgi:hypothetical protein
MSLLSVINDVCAVVGVHQMTSVFSNINNNRTAFEMLALANEMAQRIAYETREWTALIKLGQLLGDGTAESFALPPDYQRMLLNSNVWRSNNTQTPMRFIPDAEEWLWRRNAEYADSQGEWTLRGNNMLVTPVLKRETPYPADVTAWQNSHLYDVVGEMARDVTDVTLWKVAVSHTSAVSPTTFQQDRNDNPAYWTRVFTTPGEVAQFNYLNRYCVRLNSGGANDTFLNDADAFVLDERLLKLGMVWQWKANKGSPYAEDMATFMDAVARASGADKPSPIIVDRWPISAGARASYPYPTPTPADWSWPL